MADSSWPSLDDLATFTSQPSTDPVLQWALDASIAYGVRVLGESYSTEIDQDVFLACLDYAGTLYTIRVGGQDVGTDAVNGSTPQQRYRRILLAARPVGFA